VKGGQHSPDAGDWHACGDEAVDELVLKAAKADLITIQLLLLLLLLLRWRRRRRRRATGVEPFGF